MKAGVALSKRDLISCLGEDEKQLRTSFVGVAKVFACKVAKTFY